MKSHVNDKEKLNVLELEETCLRQSITHKTLCIKNRLGTGVNGVVYKACDLRKNITYALKIVRINDDEEDEDGTPDLNTEANIGNQAAIVGLSPVYYPPAWTCVGGKYGFLLLEFVPGSSWRSTIPKFPNYDVYHNLLLDLFKRLLLFHTKYSIP